jgi:hypothetical protein
MCSVSVACGVDAASDQEADTPPSEPELGAEQEGANSRDMMRMRDASAGSSSDLTPVGPGALPGILPCTANVALGSLLGCSDAGVGSPCAADACVGSLVPLPDLSDLAQTVRSATEGAVAVLAQDGGAISACQWSYATCVSSNASTAGLESCASAARSCGYEAPTAVSFDCSAAFARCFLADLFDYEHCIAVVKTCEAARM